MLTRFQRNIINQTINKILKDIKPLDPYSTFWGDLFEKDYPPRILIIKYVQGYKRELKDSFCWEMHKEDFPYIHTHYKRSSNSTIAYEINKPIKEIIQSYCNEIYYSEDFDSYFNRYPDN